jgi:hypothetical protein
MMAHELRITENVPGVSNKTLWAQITWVSVEDAEMVPPTISFSDREGNPMQGLLDVLWDSGIRPSNDRMIADSLVIDAKDAHLFDLRTILFYQLGVKK